MELKLLGVVVPFTGLDGGAGEEGKKHLYLETQGNETRTREIKDIGIPSTVLV